jgi:hypothetical protein
MGEKFPNYFILNPLTADKKLSRFIFNNKEDGVKYYPNWISGGRKVNNEIINDFIKKFFHSWVRGD